MNRSHRGSHFVSEYVSVPVGKDHTGGQRKLQESVTVAVELVTLRVAYGQKGAKWKELTDTETYFIAEDYLPIYIYTYNWVK